MTFYNIYNKKHESVVFLDIVFKNYVNHIFYNLIIATTVIMQLCYAM